MEIPGVYVEIKGDMAQLKKDMTTARQYVTEQSTSMSNAINNALTNSQIKSSTNTLVSNLSALEKGSKVTAASFKSLSTDLKDMQKVTGLADKQFASLQARMLKNQAENAQIYALKSIAKNAGLTTKEIKSLGSQFGLSTTQIKKVTTELNRTAPALSKTNTLFASLGRNVLALGSVWLGAQGLGALQRVTDEYTVIDSKLKLVTSSSEEFSAVYERLYKISQATGSSFATNAKTYTNLALALQDTNIPSSQLLQVFEDINKSLVVAGASVQETQSFLLQFKQALGANRLAGDEFKAMMEANSYWAGKFAKALGTDVNGLYEMKEAGLLTTQTVLDAHKKMTEGIEKDWLGIEKTIERAGTEWTNAWEDIIADTNRSAEGTKNVATAISELATTVHDNKDAIVGLFTGIIEAGGLAVKAVSSVVDAWKYLYNISDAQAKGHSFAEIFGMSSSDLDEMLNSTDEYGKKISELKGQIAEANAEINKLYEKRDRIGLTEDEEKIIDVYKRQIEQLESMINIAKSRSESSKEVAAVVAESVGKQIESEDTVPVAVEKASTKIVKIKTDERTQILELSKTLYEENQKILDKEVEASVKAGESMTDSWQLMYEDRYDVQSRALDAAIDLEEEKTGVMGKVWTELSSGMSSTFKTVLGEGLRGEFDSISEAFSSLLDTMLSNFVGTIASMVAEWAASGLKKLFTGESSSSSSSSDSGSSWIGTAIGTVGNWITSEWATGGTPNARGLSAYTNSIVSSPTIFPFATGGAPSLGVMGEAGSEAILPLTRVGGDLGVKADIWNNGGSSDLQESSEDNTDALDDSTDTAKDGIEATTEHTDATDKSTEATGTNTTSTGTNTTATGTNTTATGTNTTATEDNTIGLSEVAGALAGLATGLATFGLTGSISTAVSVAEKTYNVVDDYVESTESSTHTYDIDSPDAGGYSDDGDKDSNQGTAGGGNADDDNGDAGWGFADGGVINKVMAANPGDDGIAPVKLGEGVIRADTMAVLDQSIRNGTFNNSSSAQTESILQKILQQLSAVGETQVNIYGKGVEALIDSVIVKKARSGIDMSKRVYA
jgi:tape measure domain-containing protein